MRRIQALVLVAALVLLPATAAFAQSGEYTVHAGTGRVMVASGTTLIVDVTEGERLGPRKFNITDDMDLRFYRKGAMVTVLDLKVGDIISAYRTSTAAASSVTITYEEVEQHKATAAPAPAPKPAPAPAPAPAPVTLPSTGSALPLVLTLGVAFLFLGLSLTVLRRL